MCRHYCKTLQNCLQCHFNLLRLRDGPGWLRWLLMPVCQHCVNIKCHTCLFCVTGMCKWLWGICEMFVKNCEELRSWEPVVWSVGWWEVYLYARELFESVEPSVVKALCVHSYLLTCHAYMHHISADKFVLARVSFLGNFFACSICNLHVGKWTQKWEFVQCHSFAWAAILRNACTSCLYTLFMEGHWRK